MKLVQRCLGVATKFRAPLALRGVTQFRPFGQRHLEFRENVRFFSEIVATAPPAFSTDELDVDSIEGTRIAPEGQYVIAFTCCKCSHRSVKKFSKKSYNEGVVLIRCSGCQKIHLISDNLGWFGDEPTNLESIMKEKGQ